MRFVRFASILALLPLASCIPSIYPLYLPRDVVRDARVEGLWMEDTKARHTWRFEAHKDGYYAARQQDGVESGEFEARLVKLDGRLYLDLYPKAAGREAETLRVTQWWGVHFPPAHTFYKVDLAEGKLDMWAVDGSWLKRLLDRNPNALAHKAGEIVFEHTEFVITAPTKDLQAFLRRHRSDPKMWGDEPFQLVRTKEEEKK